MKKKMIITLSLIVILVIGLIINNHYSNLKNNNIKEYTNDNINDNLIAAYIYGELSTTFPTTNNYIVTVECFDKNGNPVNASATGTWNGTKWVISISNIDNGTSRCNAYFDKEEPRRWSKAESGTLLAGIKANQTEPNADDATGMTSPGRQKAENNEGFRKANDDYGISYYFRGNVTNNFVVFAKMCWRIVRIDGQGNIKLILYNYNSDKENVSNPCNVTGENLAFARDSWNSYTSVFNTTYNRNTYVGYMYSNTPNSNNYLEAHANDQDSTILTKLKTWYDANFNDAQKNLLADVIWCNDKRLASSSYNPNNWSDSTKNTGVGSVKTNYAANQRLYSSSTASPTLKCGEDKDDNKISKFTAQDAEYGNAKLYTTDGGTTKYYKIGLLTADEMAYAGAIWGYGNSSYYLNKNASSTPWWSLSPFWFNGSSAEEITNAGPSVSGALSSAGYASDAVRPAVSLASTARIASGGEGTAAKPFVVVES